MPIKQQITSSTTGYYQFGTHGKKYYYKTLKGKEQAKKKAIKQAIAIYASGYIEK